MKSICVFFVIFGFALGSQPSVWYTNTCPNAPNLSSYIINGEDAPNGKYPYMLSINYATTHHMCGASILTKDWALTAAHCCTPIQNRKDAMLFAGSNVLFENGSYHDVDFLKIHTNYTPEESWINDGCLIKVKKPFVFGEKVQQVTLPPQDWEINDGDLVNVTGWGYTDNENKTVPRKLQLGKNFVALSNEKCEALTEYNHPSYLCVMGGSKGQGVCSGDSGSPIVKNGVQIGIASWVFMPCGCGLPDFYARVPNMIDWIKEELGSDAAQLKFLNEN